MRVVSLVPSTTETLRAWGVEPVACTRYCEQPDLPTVGGTKNPDLDAIAALAPDLVVMDTTENTSADAEALQQRGVAVLATDVHALADVGPELRRLAAAVGVDPSVVGAPAPVGGDRAGSAAGRGGRADRGAGAEPVRLRAFVPIWRRPWMTISGRTYGSTLLSAIGVANVYADHDDWFPTVALDDVARLRPDVVLAPTEPYEFKAPHLAELAALAPVEVVDGRDLFWWGVRTPAALERLRAQLVR